MQMNPFTKTHTQTANKEESGHVRRTVYPQHYHTGMPRILRFTIRLEMLGIRQTFPLRYATTNVPQKCQ